MSDGGLPKLIQTHVPLAHWQRLESGITGRGIPDLNGCLDGHEIWLECKVTSGWKVDFQVGQVAWAERRRRAGGTVWLAVRRKTTAGPRRGAAVDELWLYHGGLMRDVELRGLLPSDEITNASVWRGGPRFWHWAKFSEIIFA